MALDIAAGRRFPTFFDGQRYMGALEPYTAAFFASLFGHSPTGVALAPLFYFGVFVGSQYAVWRCWSGRPTGHLAALISLTGAPMLALWSIVPRGGYVELLAWSLPVLGLYRAVSRPDSPRLTPIRQTLFGLLLAFGYYLNPLSWIIYLAMAADWTFGCHGADLRRERRLEGGWVDRRRSWLVWVLAAAAFVSLLALCCHIEFRGDGEPPLVFLMGVVPPAVARPLGAAGVALLLGGALWWSGLAGRLTRVLAGYPWAALGAALAVSPFLLHDVCVRLGVIPVAQSFPLWIRAPWDIGGNARDVVQALGVLVGCDPGGVGSVLRGQGVALPGVVWPSLVHGLGCASPAVVALALALIAAASWHDRETWRRFWGLRGNEPPPPTILAMLGLGCTVLLYLLQATNPNATTSSTVRYLVPAWVFLPGVLANGLRSCGRVRGLLAAGLLLAAWTTAQVNLWAELGRPSPHRPLATELERRGVTGIVAETPVALIVANLTHGHVGAAEFRPIIPRLGRRYADRFPEGKPVACVVDLQAEWSLGEGLDGSRVLNLGPTLLRLADRYPDKVRASWRVGPFEVWEVDLPLSEIVTPRDPDLLFSRPGSAKVAPVVVTTP